MQKVIPAILTADPEVLKEQLDMLKGNSEWVHVDIMDGTFVPNTSVEISALKAAAESFNLEIHLMVAEPQKYFKECQGIGAKKVIFHYEVSSLKDVLEDMGEYAFQKGMALNPDSPVNGIAAHEEKLNAILFMSIIPGFQGQKFIPDVLNKIKQGRELFPNLVLGIDGGIGEQNIEEVIGMGLDYAIVGSRIWKAENPMKALKSLEEMVQ